MAPPTLAAGLLVQAVALAHAEAGVEVSYTQYPGSNSYTNYFGHFGGGHLDHCHREASTLQECQDWCSQDCECHCLVVFEPNGACFRRHSCDTSSFDDDSQFSVYVKDNFTGDCSSFEDMGFHTECEGPSLQFTDVGTVETLEDCKLDCAMQNFECTGIQFMSDCRNSTANVCRFFNTTITSARTSVPEGSHVNSHCLRYKGSVEGADGTVAASFSMTIGGVDGAALVKDAAAAGKVKEAIKDSIGVIAPSMDRGHMTVDLRPGSLVADVQVELPSRAGGIKFLHQLADVVRPVFVKMAAIKQFYKNSGGPGPTMKKWHMSPLKMGAKHTGADASTGNTTPGPNYAILALGGVFVAVIGAVLYCMLCGRKSADEEEDDDSSDDEDVSS